MIFGYKYNIRYKYENFQDKIIELLLNKNEKINFDLVFFGDIILVFGMNICFLIKIDI